MSWIGASSSVALTLQISEWCVAFKNGSQVPIRTWRSTVPLGTLPCALFRKVLRYPVCHWHCPRYRSQFLCIALSEFHLSRRIYTELCTHAFYANFSWAGIIYSFPSYATRFLLCTTDERYMHRRHHVFHERDAVRFYASEKELASYVMKFVGLIANHTWECRPHSWVPTSCHALCQAKGWCLLPHHSICPLTQEVSPLSRFRTAYQPSAKGYPHEYQHPNPNSASLIYQATVHSDILVLLSHNLMIGYHVMDSS